MEFVLWVGPKAAPPQLVELLAQQQTDLKSYPTTEALLGALDTIEASVAVVVSEWDQAHATVEKLRANHPDVQVLLASASGLPRNVVLGMWAGASGVLEFTKQSRNEIILEIQEWITRHRELMRERDLFVRLHQLNEEFLKIIVEAEKRNLELQEKVEAGQRPQASDEGAPQVLLIDDEPVILDVLKRILEKSGVQCVAVPDGEAGVKQLWEKGFNLVITDKNLPGMSGLDVLAQVKQLSPDTDVMMITGYSSKEAAIDAINAGASGYIEKPFDDIKNVRARIEKVLEAQRERLKKRRYLNLIKDRNQEFLGRYKVLRSDLEAWMASHHQAVLLRQ
jgi:DNA-binding NtrC family response regulator